MLRARAVQPTQLRWQCGRIRLRSVELRLNRGLNTAPRARGDKVAQEPKDGGFTFGSTIAGPGPKAGEPRPTPEPRPQVGSNFVWAMKTIGRAVKDISNAYADTQILKNPLQSSWIDRQQAVMPMEDTPGLHLSHNNRRYASLKKLADPDLIFWKLIPKAAKFFVASETIPPDYETVIDTYVAPWTKYRQARERVLLLKRNWPAIPEDVKRTVKWNNWLFPGGRLDLFKYEGFDPNTLLWTDVINKYLTEPPVTDAINARELWMELVGEGIDEPFDEPEKGGPDLKDDPLLAGPTAPFSADVQLPPYEPYQVDILRRERAKQNMLTDIARGHKRREVLREQWSKGKEQYFIEEAAANGTTVEEEQAAFTRAVNKTGTYWGDFFSAPVVIPKDYKFFEGEYLDDPNRLQYEKQFKIKEDQERLGVYSLDSQEPLIPTPDPPEKPYQPDPPEVLAKVIAEIREEEAAKTRHRPDPYAKTWPEEMMKKHKELLRLKREKEDLMQQVLNSGNIEGYVQLKTKDMIHGGTFEMVGSSAEMQRIQKEKGHPGPIGRAFAWLINQPYRLPTASFPSETWIPPFEQDPDRYSLRAYPDPFEISTWRFRRTETGYIGRIADWFSFRNNGKQWWWQPGDQIAIRRFELWWQDYKEGDEFWSKVAPHVLRTSWFRRVRNYDEYRRISDVLQYAMEYYTGAESRTLNDMHNLEDFASLSCTLLTTNVADATKRERLDFDLYRKAVKGKIMEGVEVEKTEVVEETKELRWGPVNEFREATVDPTTGGITAPGWLLATSGTKKMTLREGLEILGFSAQLKAGQLPPLDEAKTRSDQLDAANQTESARLATGWRRVVRELLGDPLLEPKVIEMHEVTTKVKNAAHSGKSPYLGGKAHAAYLALERAHQGITLTPEDELFLKLVNENAAAEATAAAKEAEGAVGPDGGEKPSADASGAPKEQQHAGSDTKAEDEAKKQGEAPSAADADGKKTEQK